jgi:hypothetical protein
MRIVAREVGELAGKRLGGLGKPLPEDAAEVDLAAVRGGINTS